MIENGGEGVVVYLLPVLLTVAIWECGEGRSGKKVIRFRLGLFVHRRTAIIYHHKLHVTINYGKASVSRNYQDFTIQKC